MKRFVALAGLALVVAGCGTDETDGDTGRATDRTGDRSSPTSTTPTPVVVPAATGPVRSRYAPTVMDVGAGEQLLCLGPVAESYPPQCTGPVIAGWDWEALEPHVEHQDDVRWGTYAVTGTWDGETFAVTDAVPAALYDPAFEAPPLPTPSRGLDDAELSAIADDLGTSLPGALGAFADQEGHVLVDVVYDDGTIQDAVDARYGEGVVVVSGGLVDVG